MYKSIPEEKGVTTFQTPHGSLMALFHFMIGEFEVRKPSLVHF